MVTMTPMPNPRADAQPDVLVPHAAFDLLLELAEYSRTGGQTTPVGQRAIEALDAAGLLPKAAS